MKDFFSGALFRRRYPPKPHRLNHWLQHMPSKLHRLPFLVLHLQRHYGFVPKNSSSTLLQMLLAFLSK
jgi:hypothetical protein